jgi:hypothetical protein
MFSIAVSDRDAAAFIVPEILLLRNRNDKPFEAIITGLEQYASFAKHSNIAKAVDEALCAETEGIDCDRFGNVLFQIVVDNPFTVNV